MWITQRAPERGYSSGIDSLRVVTHWRLFCLFIRLFSVPYSFVLVPVISCEKNGGDRSVAYVVVVQLVPVVSRTIPETDTRLTLRVAIRNRQIFSKPSFGRSCVRNRIRAPTIIGSFLTSPNFLTRSRRFPAIGVLARVDGLFATWCVCAVRSLEDYSARDHREADGHVQSLVTCPCPLYRRRHED